MEPVEMGELCHRVIGAAMKVHSALGPGFLEEVYKNALLRELGKAGLACEKEVPLEVRYDGVCVGRYQADIIVEKRLILELKSVAALVARHGAQLVNYLTETGIDDGLLLNFGAESLQFKHKYRVFRRRGDGVGQDLQDLQDFRPVFPFKNPENPVNPVK